MDTILDRRDFLTRVATVSLAVTGGAMLGATAVPTLATTQEASPAAAPIPVAELPEPTDDGIEVPVLGIAFGSEEIVATPKVPAGTVRILTAVPYEDFGSVIFRIPDDRPHAIDQIWAAFAQPEPEIPSWVFDLYCPGGVRTDYRYGTTAEGFISLLPGVYAVMDFATGRSTTFVAMGSTNGAIDPKDVPYMDGRVLRWRRLPSRRPCRGRRHRPRPHDLHRTRARCACRATALEVLERR